MINIAEKPDEQTVFRPIVFDGTNHESVINTIGRDKVMVDFLAGGLIFKQFPGSPIQIVDAGDTIWQRKDGFCYLTKIRPKQPVDRRRKRGQKDGEE